MAFGDHKRALYDFSAAIRKEAPKSFSNFKVETLSEAYMQAGQCCYLLGQFDDAITQYNLAIAKYDRDPQTYFNRGITFVA